MSQPIRSEWKLGKALKQGEDTLEIDGNLRESVFKIRATGRLAWALAIGGIVVLVCLVLRGAFAAPAALLSAAPAVAILGPRAAVSAALIAAAAGGASKLNRLRQYREVQESGGTLLLQAA